MGDKEATKASCGQLIRDKGINLNMPIRFMTLLEEAILRRLEDAAEILIELSSEMKIPLGRKDGLGKKDGPSLLHIAAYTPKAMRDLLRFREIDCEMLQDTEVFNCYAQTRVDHPGRSYASVRIVKALLKTDLKSKIHEPEWPNNPKTTPFYGVNQFLESIEYLRKHPEADPKCDVDFEEEYREIRKLFGPIPASRPPNVFPYCQNAMQIARVLNEMEKK
jgi:hypothetical protein